MAADNHTTIVGNLVEDPELPFTNTGTVANLRVAVTQRVHQDGSWEPEKSTLPRRSSGDLHDRRSDVQTDAWNLSSVGVSPHGILWRG